MSCKHDAYVKAAVAGAVTGGVTFLAVKCLCAGQHSRKRTAMKAFDMVVTLIDALSPKLC